ncbi:MAG TPA: tol-pal system protein, partial [Myxococcaceae bacterium]|nr:tol-pal system protein [Myxococcaceae bacterium]
MKPLLFALLLASSLLSGCFYPASRGHALEDKVALENEQIRAELKDMKDKLSETLPKIDAKITEMTKALESLDRASRSSGADTGVRLQKTIEDLGELRGKVETYLFRISELEKGVKKVEDDTDQRLSELQGPDAAKAAAARRKAEDLPRPSDKKQFLALADSKARDGDLALARILYGDFLKKWPKDDLVGEARFGLAETYYSDNKCREALGEYGKVIQEFSKTKSAPYAYLHSADCFGRLKMKDESRL